MRQPRTRRPPIRAPSPRLRQMHPRHSTRATRSVRSSRTFSTTDACPFESENPLKTHWHRTSSSRMWRGNVDACPGMVAVPNELIVAVGPGAERDAEVARVVEVLIESGLEAGPSTELTANAEIVSVEADVAQVLPLLATLQGFSASVDLNYLEPVLPRNIFRPADDPLPATEQQVLAFNDGWVDRCKRQVGCGYRFDGRSSGLRPGWRGRSWTRIHRPRSRSWPICPVDHRQNGRGRDALPHISQ